MANRYGEAALLAAHKVSSGDINPIGRWESAMETVYPTSPTARKKSSPRGAFLGLCEAGLVRGIPAGHYGASATHKAYAVRAAELLIEGKQNWSTTSLWRSVENDPAKPHNGQMDILLALWKNDFIVRKT